MEQSKTREPASAEFVAGMVAKLEIAFYETPETLFDALTKTILFLKFTEKEVTGMVNKAIFTVKKTKLSIADIVKEQYEDNKSKITYADIE